MRYPHLKVLLITLGLLFSLSAAAATEEEQRVSDATDVLDQLLRIPEKSIPPSLLSRAYAVAVVPNVIKAGFVIGARRGKGIIVVRQDDETWSNPAFVTLTGGSVGWQAGVESSDIILVFKTRKGVTNISNGKLTLGAEASVSAGPVGRNAAVATDVQFKAEVMSYSRSRGLFAGVALDGTGVTMDRKANTAFYGSAEMSPDAIFASSPNIAPDIANSFVQLLTAQTSRLPTAPGMQSGVAGTTSARPPSGNDTSEVRTYGMPDPEE
jgi:lipid-binding SYLF domain-containing protein